MNQSNVLYINEDSGPISTTFSPNTFAFEIQSFLHQTAFGKWRSNLVNFSYTFVEFSGPFWDRMFMNQMAKKNKSLNAVYRPLTIGVFHFGIKLLFNFLGWEPSRQVLVYSDSLRPVRQGSTALRQGWSSLESSHTRRLEVVSWSQLREGHGWRKITSWRKQE